MSVAKNLMAGRILEDGLFPYPRLRDKDREVLGLMLDAIDQFLGPRQQDFKRWDREAEQPAQFIQGLRDLGLFGLIIPEEHGGLGLSNAGYARVLSQSSTHDSSVSLTIGAHSSIGMKGILLFGTAEQKARYAARRSVLAAGLTAAGFRIDHSQAGLYLWATRPGLDCWAACELLAAECGILVGPGSMYGPAGNAHIRVALTATDERVAAAGERLQRLPAR